MSVTTAGLMPAPTERLLDSVRLAVLPESATWELRDGVLEIHCAEAVEIRLSVPLGDAVGFWHPDAWWNRTIVADWAGLAHVSLVRGAATGCLYDSSGASMLAFAALDPVPEVVMRYGVSEESKTFVVHLHVPAGRSPYRIALAPQAPSVAAAMRALRRAPEERPVPEGARVPVYSTWYGFSQDVAAEPVEAEARLAAELGCGALIMDDGWQELGTGRGYAGVGDWRPDLTKFPDLAGHVGRVQGMGLKYLLWVAPLLLGPQAACFEELSPLAPLNSGVPGARVLDPRLPEVREHVVAMCVRLMRDYGLDGLKLDFLDRATLYGDGVGAAMHELLTELAGELGPEALIEFRQPYVAPGTPLGNMLRADDCPADAVANRVRTIDIALRAAGGAVHGDMLMWDPAGSTRSAARQLIGTLHAVPQISARIGELPREHRRMVAFWLERWHELRPLLLDGEIEPGRPDELYPVVRAERGDECVITVTADRVVPLDGRFRKITVVNGTATGRLVVEVAGEGFAVRRVHDAEGSRIDPSAAQIPAGLGILNVPASGMAVLEGNP